MKVHLLDGTYELFRHHFAVPSRKSTEGEEVAAIYGVLSTVLTMLEGGVTHLGVATDHVIESFRNDLWPGYKSSEGMAPELLAQFGPLEDGLRSMGVTVFAMVELEADDALAAAAATACAEPAVDQVLICTPDKDLAQCVRDGRVVQFDRRKGGRMIDEAGVIERFGVAPASIPDYLALVGDSADGYPGIKGWGAKSAAAVLRRYGHLEDIPEHHWRWEGVAVSGAARLAATLSDNRELAFLFRDLATLRADAPVLADVEQLRWAGPTPDFPRVCEALQSARLAERAESLAARPTR
jgi:5'-3' exonuclease